MTTAMTTRAKATRVLQGAPGWLTALLLIAGAGAGLGVGTAQAQTPPAGACCAATTSRLDELLNPVVGGDEDFFTQPAGPPNVAFVIDNSGSMLNSFPVSFCTDDAYRNDCNCPAVDALGYRPDQQYEAEIRNLNSGSHYDDWFRRDRVYDIRNYSQTAPSYGDNGPGTSPVANTWPVSGAYNVASSYSTASGGACHGVNAGARARCQQCLATKGYFIGERHRVANDANVRTDWRLTGNFLNFVAPRYVMVRKVVKQVIRDIQPVRMMTILLNESNGSAGPRVLTDFNPPCNLSDPTRNASHFYSNRQSILNALDGSLRFNGNSPLTKNLYGAGYAFQLATSDPTQHVYRQSFGTTWDSAMGLTSGQVSALTERGGHNQRAVCFSCTFNSIIVLTDGQPRDPHERSVPGSVGQNPLQWADCPECGDTHLDEVASFLWSADLRPDLPGQQNVATYTIGFGLEEGHWSGRLLRNTAQAGGGRYFGASNTTQLRRAILDVLEDINSRNTAFSAANVASLQVSGSAQTAVVPRMSPRRDLSWLGTLWRFGLYNEFIENNDLNGNGTLDDIFVVDADGSIVVEDYAGRFVKRESQSSATPHWEANARLQEAAGGQQGWQLRNVWTVRDTAAPSGAFTSADTLTRFSSANWADLAPYLGVAGTGACPSVNADLTINAGGILEGLGLPFARAAAIYGTQTLPLDLSSLRLLANSVCHRVLIDWTLGRDLGDEDGDGNLDETRLSVLGDIFHSSPVTVDPPVDRFLCDLGLHNQCVRTLYSDDLGVPRTPHVPQTIPGTCGAAARTGADAYDRWHFDNRTREKVVVVGANDGMLHAFRDTRGQSRCDGGVELVDFVMSPDSGREAWALIPPDALSRLHLQLTEGHKYFVDGDVMVRDLWNDDDGDGRKRPEEFRTVAIAAMGRGGNHYFAVELLWEDAGGARISASQPRFLWMFPQPCSEESALFGKTLYSLSPKPPPLGPVLLQRCEAAAPNATDGTPDTSCGTGRYDVGTEERWVAMLSGGWSPGQEKGRGVYMVDAYRGVATSARTDNLLWKFEYDPDASGEREEPKRGLTHSIVAPVSMVDYGANDDVRMDGFFDTGVVGDLGGQLWLFRFHRPGQLDPATGLVRNWAGARTFQQDLQGAPSVARTWPFFLPASIGLQPDNNALRAFVGTGNRYELLSQRAGSCQFDDPLACAKYGCSSQVTTAVRKHTVSVSDSSTSWSAGQSFSGADQSRASASALGMCGTATAEVSRHDIGCGVGSVRTPRAECRVNAAGVYTCARTDTTTMNLGTVATAGTAARMNALGFNRFYGIWVYGRIASRMFEEDRVSTDTGGAWRTARQFDSARATDRRSSGSGDLVDVTGTTCDASGTCTGAQASADGLGWFFEYRDRYGGAPDRDLSLSHKTASGASLIASCTLWNSLYPMMQTGVCGASSTARARFHQADFVTGAPNCAYSFGGQRFREREVLAPPPEPAVAVQYSRETGQLRLSSLLVEPGRDRATTVGVTESTDLLQSVYELPVSRELHDCRHSPRGCRPTVP